MEIDIYGECSGRFNKDQKTKSCPRQSTLKFLKKVLLFPEKKTFARKNVFLLNCLYHCTILVILEYSAIYYI